MVNRTMFTATQEPSWCILSQKRFSQPYKALGVTLAFISYFVVVVVELLIS